MKIISPLVWIITSLTPLSALAEDAKFSFLKTVSIQDLNTILDAERRDFIKNEKFEDGNRLPAASKSKNPVDIYTVHYTTTIPKRNNERIKVSGLLALPKLDKRSPLPLIAYQHGTVYDRYGVPSYAFKTKTPSPHNHLPESYENRYMVALFGGDGYAVMAADYVGFGDDAKNNEAYLIKSVSAQASLDLYREVNKFLAQQRIGTSNFFLGGWSQGGINTTGFLEQLELQGVNVKAAFTVASPNDPLASVHANLFHPLKTDDEFIGPMLGQLAFSCETYEAQPGLAKESLNPTYYEKMKSVYERSYGYQPGDPYALFQIMKDWQDVSSVTFLKDALRTPAAFVNSAFGRCLAGNATYRQEFKTDLRMYYGNRDIYIRPRVARLAYDYNLALNATQLAESEVKIIPVFVKGGTHRLTFITGSVDAKSWMDSLR
jgi:hypothetical protein